MKKRSKGFSLIELIVVLLLIAILLLIISPSIIDAITEFKENKRIEIIENSIISATKIYLTDSKYDMNIICDNNNKEIDVNVTIDYLIENNYLTINNNDLTKIDKDNFKVTYDCSTKKYSYQF